MPSSPQHRRLVVRLLPALLVALLAVLSAGPASAADGYRYWNYFHLSKGAYVFAQTGPADFKPKDGAIEAYRYGLSSAADGIKPRTAATTYSLSDICGSTKAGTGKKRVGVLIDYGTAADSASGDVLPKPRAACAVVPSAANGQQVLDQVADVRVQKQLTCGIDGYPASSCSVTVKSPPAPAAEKDVAFVMPAAADLGSGATTSSSKKDDGGFPWPVVGVVVVVVLLGGGALVLTRRSRDA